MAGANFNIQVIIILNFIFLFCVNRFGGILNFKGGKLRHCIEIIISRPVPEYDEHHHQ